MDKINTKFITKEKIPLVIEPRDSHVTLDDLKETLTKNNAIFKEQMLIHGGLLFRGFPIHNEDDFAEVIKHLNTGKLVDYIGGDSPRIKIKHGIYTSTEAPPSIKIPLHNELSFVKYHPKHIYFYCQTASQVGGETIIADSRQVYRSIKPSILEKFNSKRLKYVSHYYHRSQLMDFINSIQPSHKSWAQVFETESQAEVERKCRENEFGFKWHKNNWLEITQTRPATTEHPITKDKIWFNQVHLFDFNPRLLGWWRYCGAKLVYSRPHTCLHEVYFADNTEIPRSELYHVMDQLDANTIAFPWQKGDVLALDNMLTMHGRSTFTGKRRILAAMTA